MKNYIAKCYKCYTRYEGRYNNLSDFMRENNLKKKGKKLYCDCKIIDEIARKENKKKKYNYADYENAI